MTLRVGDLVAEVTTLREDVETDGRHAVVKFGTDWVRDAERRDFTLNALYVGMDGELFDPLGGADDCLAGIVRFIGDADQRIAEDRLRVYRFFRFSASHGQEQFDAEGLAAAVRAAGTLGELSAERVGAEMMRMLALPKVATNIAGDGSGRYPRAARGDGRVAADLRAARAAAQCDGATRAAAGKTGARAAPGALASFQ